MLPIRTRGPGVAALMAIGVATAGGCGSDDLVSSTSTTAGGGVEASTSSSTGGGSVGIGGAGGAGGAGGVGEGGAEPVEGIWISADEVMALPTSGPAWEALLADAQAPLGTPDLSDQDQDHNVATLAKGMVCTRLGDAAMCDEARQAVMAIPETENGGRTLALGRELLAYVIVADLVGLSPGDDDTFKQWLDAVRTEDLDGRTLISTHADRPNNWGTHAGASRLAASIYLGDEADVLLAAQVFEGWLGNRDVYASFSYGDLDWQADPENPVGINPMGATQDGHSIDGVIPDDQRRGGPFTWPPPKENYVWEALQGALAQAVILHRRGYPAFEWEDQALRRAVAWLHEQANYPAEGDDEWLSHIVNHYYGTSYPVVVPAQVGKNAGYTDWTHP